MEPASDIPNAIVLFIIWTNQNTETPISVAVITEFGVMLWLFSHLCCVLVDEHRHAVPFQPTDLTVKELKRANNSWPCV